MRALAVVAVLFPAALITAVLIPIQLAVFMAYPFPDTVTGWFTLLQDNPLAGLVDLDLLLVVDNVLLVVIALALYVALRRASPSLTTIATGLWLLAIAMFIAANPAVEMLALSDRFAAATTEAQRSMSVAAGQALLAGWEGTAFQVGYVVGQLAGIGERSRCNGGEEAVEVGSAGPDRDQGVHVGRAVTADLPGPCVERPPGPYLDGGGQCQHQPHRRALAQRRPDERQGEQDRPGHGGEDEAALQASQLGPRPPLALGFLVLGAVAVAPALGRIARALDRL